MKISLYLITLLCILINTGMAQRKSSLSTIVKIESGVIEGTTNAKGDIKIFKGIPFAAPPVGNLRWKAPQPVEPWTGTKKCVAFSASPMQTAPKPNPRWTSEYLIPKEPISEDCLYLNVWSGAMSAAEKLPVMVFIYGGGFTGGGSASPIYDGEALAKKGVVFVSVNYRVGVFGLLAHPELSKESGYGASGNYSLLDLIAALQWIQKNIAAFGGNPKNVTITGHSAGAFLNSFLATSPLSKGLFQRVIAESGGKFYNGTIWDKMVDIKAAEERGVILATSLNCTSLAELRAKPADEIMKATDKPNRLIFDGYSLIETPLDTYKKGKQNDVPTLVGWNNDESGGMIKPLKTDAYREQIEKRFENLSKDFLSVYPFQTDEEAEKSQADLYRDERFGLQCYTWANRQAQTGKSKVFVYNFNRELPAYTPETQFGASHSGEVAYAYNNLHILNRPWEEVDHKIAEVMSTYWVNFAKTGNPNGNGLPQWEPYDPIKENVMVIDTVMGSKPLPTKDKMLFWEKYFEATSGEKK